MANDFSPYTLLAEAKKRGYKSAVIDNYVFWLNPTDFSMRTAPVYINQPTRDGVGRFQFNMEPYTYTIRGFTGNSGGKGLYDSSEGMQQFRPMFGKGQGISKQKPVRFSFPYRNLHSRLVYVDFFEDTMTASDNPFLFFYNIQMTELPPTKSYRQRTVGASLIPTANGQRLPGPGGPR